MDDFLRIAKELGLPGLALFMGFWLCIKVGAACYEGLAWCGPNFLVPVRDGLIGNINILTQFILEIRATLPMVLQSNLDVKEAVARQDLMTAEQAKELAKTRATARAVVQVMSQRCPETAEDCPFKQKDVLDSDER